MMITLIFYIGGLLDYLEIRTYLLSKMSRVRFDNFDDRWEVATKPHHTHSRYKEKATKSPFRGILSEDTPILYNLVQQIVYE